jgi:hypothetical protein
MISCYTTLLPRQLWGSFFPEGTVSCNGGKTLFKITRWVANYVINNWIINIDGQEYLTAHTFLRSILLLSFHLHPGLPSGLFSSGFPTKTLYECFSSPMRPTCAAHPILLDFSILIIFGEEYKLWTNAIFSYLLIFHPSWAQNSPQYPGLKHPHSMFFP